MTAKILVIKLGALGDILMSAPAILSLAAAHREDQLTLLTSPAFTGLFSHWPELETRAFPRKGLANTLQTMKWVRSRRFDRIYDLQSNDRSRLFCLVSGARELVGNHSRFPYTHHPGEDYRGQCHIFAWQKKVLASAGVSLSTEQPCFPEHPQDRERVQAWLARHCSMRGRIVLLHAGASPGRPEKRWPHFARMAQTLEDAGFTPIWLGAEADAELNAGFARLAGIDASCAFSISELIELGRHAVFAITNDSGPMHALACSGIPVYALFGPSNWQRNHAIGQKQHVVCLAKSNEVWHSEDYSPRDAARLELITPEMLWSVLVQDQRITP